MAYDPEKNAKQKIDLLDKVEDALTAEQSITGLCSIDAARIHIESMQYHLHALRTITPRPFPSRRRNNPEKNSKQKIDYLFDKMEDALTTLEGLYSGADDAAHVHIESMQYHLDALCSINSPLSYLHKASDIPSKETP